jgi:iron complex transport system substrate-binding protein
VARLLGVADAAASGAHIDAAVSAAAQSLPASAQRHAGVFRGQPRPYAAGESSFIGETLTRLGVKNIVPAKLGPFPKLNPEFVVRANPDLIMVGERNFAAWPQRPGWRACAHCAKSACACSARRIRHAGAPGPAHGRGRAADGAVHRDKGNPRRSRAKDPAASQRHSQVPALTRRHARALVLRCCCSGLALGVWAPGVGSTGFVA